MTDAAGKYKKMEDGMHVTALVEAVEDRSSNIEYALGNNPNDGSRADGFEQWLECNKNGKSHAHETKGLCMAVLFQPAETDNGASDG